MCNLLDAKYTFWALKIERGQLAISRNITHDPTTLVLKIDLKVLSTEIWRNMHKPIQMGTTQSSTNSGLGCFHTLENCKPDQRKKKKGRSPWTDEYFKKCHNGRKWGTRKGIFLRKSSQTWGRPFKEGKTGDGEKTLRTRPALISRPASSRGQTARAVVRETGRSRGPSRRECNGSGLGGQAGRPEVPGGKSRVKPGRRPRGPGAAGAVNLTHDPSPLSTVPSRLVVGTWTWAQPDQTPTDMETGKMREAAIEDQAASGRAPPLRVPGLRLPPPVVQYSPELRSGSGAGRRARRECLRPGQGAWAQNWGEVQASLF